MGVIVGTYSSVFVASPLLVAWHVRTGGSLIKKK
jgi:preprotein translocase subunit SecF